MRPDALFPAHDLRLHLPPGRDADVDSHHGSHVDGNASGAGTVVAQKTKKAYSTFEDGRHNPKGPKGPVVSTG